MGVFLYRSCCSYGYFFYAVFAFCFDGNGLILYGDGYFRFVVRVLEGSVKGRLVGFGDGLVVGFLFRVFYCGFGEVVGPFEALLVCDLVGGFRGVFAWGIAHNRFAVALAKDDLFAEGAGGSFCDDVMFRYCHIAKIRLRLDITMRILSLCEANIRYGRV